MLSDQYAQYTLKNIPEEKKVKIIIIILINSTFELIKKVMFNFSVVILIQTSIIYLSNSNNKTMYQIYS